MGWWIGIGLIGTLIGIGLIGTLIFGGLMIALGRFTDASLDWIEKEDDDVSGS